MVKEKVVGEVKKEAEGYFERGEFSCSEAVLYTINNLLGKPYDDSIVKMASGFTAGVGQSGCICGAVSGGIMALGMVYGRTYGEKMNDKMLPLSKALHDYIKEDYNATCCRILTKDFSANSPEKKNHCITITGKVAAWVANKLIEDGKVQI